MFTLCSTEQDQFTLDSSGLLKVDLDVFTTHISFQFKGWSDKLCGQREMKIFLNGSRANYANPPPFRKIQRKRKVWGNQQCNTETGNFHTASGISSKVIYRVSLSGGIL
ncbi:hypothetical protein JHK82_034736 [Glycine max]|uniref:Uncharacterized protein n=2 Tax=Glycine subgen. Soja TaxID=1462606 RepID=A0A0R0H9Q8_SOYBN|nr:hypothetical protein JHK85_035455 [Glycine max]KAG5120316.1 hypothetical protein JHK82_034736 [Glycine max]KAG5141301.1 hypothetical protein JHK84_035069 [Glycine max]KAH1144511.1 hypothetical protein GYH30_034646 [Glycine max]KAH1222891.1 hypothetical protein GmHk_12G035931 [Glycine max]